MFFWPISALVCITLIISVRAKINCQVRSIKLRSEVNMGKSVCVFSVTEKYRVPRSRADRHACRIHFGKKKIINTVPAKKAISELCWGTVISEIGNLLWYSSYALQTSLILFALLPSLHLSITLSTWVSINSRRNRIRFYLFGVP